MDFGGKVVVVAGGTGALGSAVCRAFLFAGARVIATYLHTNEFDALRAEAGAAAARLSGSIVDLTNAEAAATLVENTLAQHGRLDILVNAIGGYAGGKNLWEVDAATYGRMFDLNLRPAFVLSRAVIPVMIRQGRGAIVSVSSRAALGHAAGASLYAASKAASLVLMNSLAEEVKGHNINVNSVLPSIIDTLANRKDMPDADYSAWPKPDEIARVILFLSSEDAKLIHGASIPVYGRS